MNNNYSGFTEENEELKTKYKIKTKYKNCKAETFVFYFFIFFSEAQIIIIHLPNKSNAFLLQRLVAFICNSEKCDLKLYRNILLFPHCPCRVLRDALLPIDQTCIQMC